MFILINSFFFDISILFFAIDADTTRISPLIIAIMHNFAIAHNFTYKRLVFNYRWVDNGRRYNDGLSPSGKNCVLCLYCLPKFNLSHIRQITVSIRIIPIFDCKHFIPWLFHHIVTQCASVGKITFVGCRGNNIERIYEMHPQDDNIFPGGESSVTYLVFAIVV